MEVESALTLQNAPNERKSPTEKINCHSNEEIVEERDREDDISQKEGPEITEIPQTFVKHSSSQFECIINNCGKVVKTLRSVLKHAETHQDRSTYKFLCEEPGCGKRFLKKYSLEVHYRVHMDLRPYICAICGKSFRGSGDLERHFRIHTGVKPYKCLFKNCEKSYSQPENLRIHVRTHTGDRPFACTHPNCDKDFYSKSNLIAHLRIHQGIRPYVCEMCQMAFTENSSLYKHRQIHLRKMALEGKSTETATTTSTTSSEPRWPNPSPQSTITTNSVQENQFHIGLESSKERFPDGHSPLPKTTIMFLSATNSATQIQSHLTTSVKNTVLLASAAESRMSDHSPIPEDLDEDNSSDDPVSDKITEFEDEEKEFNSDVDRSADLGLDRITHQPDASIKMGLDEFMNSIRPDNMTTEYFNGEINFI